MKIKPKWQIQKSISRVRRHSLLYRDDKLGVQCEVHTTTRGWRHYFFIDDDDREFRTEAALIQALTKDDKAK